MRLEPIFLLAPKPKPASVPTRRAFLIAGGTFFAGIGLGGACGYAAGSRVGGDSDDASKELFEPSGDSQLDELRRIAVAAPLEELIEKRDAILHFTTSAYPRDKYLWRGIERLIEATLIGQSVPNRRPFALWLAQFVERGDQEFARPLAKHIPDLRKVK